MKLSVSRSHTWATLACALWGMVGAAPIVASDKAEAATLSAANLFSRQANAPTYEGPKDVDGMPTFDGTLEYAIANWPDPERVNDAVFWTGGSLDRAVPTSFIQTQLGGKGTWFEQVFTVNPGDASSKFILDAQKGQSDDIRWKATARTSQAFAQYASGTAWLLIPKGVSEVDPYPGLPKEQGGTGRFANWVFFEYNTLTRNALVGKIIRVNPEDFSDQQTLWTKGDAPFGDPATTDSDTEPRWLSCPGDTPTAQIEPADDGI